MPMGLWGRRKVVQYGRSLFFMNIIRRLLGKRMHDGQQQPEKVNRQNSQALLDHRLSGEANVITSAPYLLAHDLPEHKRLEFQHFFLKGLLHANYLAPVNNKSLRAILDVGSGTGRWVVEVAQQFPQANVTGIDLLESKISAPLNAMFVQQNVLEGLPFTTDCFDYVHSRLLVAGIPAVSWPGLLREYVRVTRPGGWIELLEGGTTFVNAGPQTEQFLAWWNQYSLQRGIDAAFINKIPDLLHMAGAIHVQTRVIHVPLGEWGGRTGSLLLTNITAGWGGLRETFVTQLGISPSQFDYTMSQLPEEWERLHTLYEYVAVLGQVPAS
jgi:hypothetical protein